MKYLTLFLGIISYGALCAQKNHSPARARQIYIGVNFSPDYAYRTLKKNGGDQYTDEVIKSRNEKEAWRFGYTGGFNLGMIITKHFGVEAGVQYSNKNYQTRQLDLFYQQPDPAMPQTARYIYIYHYVDVPLKLNMSFGENRLRFVSSLGCAINFLLNASQRGVFEYSNGKTERRDQSSIYDFREINFSPQVSAGAEYRIKNKMYLRVEPTFRRTVLKNIDTPVTEFLWSGGINMGLYYQLY